MLYLDSSALAKLVTLEAESGALREYLGRRTDQFSAALARIELTRVGRLRGGSAPALATDVIGRLELIPLDETLLWSAAALTGPRLKSLDAIHVAAAQALGPELEALVTYDVRMQAAARELGLPVVVPQP